ncbi:hypothetical protein Aduo_001719 [Ancylostoma duodenale]
MSAPSPKSSRSSPIRIRKKFPESWIFICMDSNCFLYSHRITSKHTNGCLVFDFGGFGGGGFIGGAAVDFEGAPPMPQMPVDDMMMVRAFSDTGAPPPVKIRTEFPESWIVVSINTEYV